MDGPEDAASERRYPDFLCIGAQKAGTTWLDKNLRRHPALWLPPMKELQYFSHLHLPATRKWTTRQRRERERRERGSQLLRRYFERTIPRIGTSATSRGSPISPAGRSADDWYGRIFSLAPRERICGEVTPDYATLP